MASRNKEICNKKSKSVGYFLGDTAHQLEGYMLNLLRPFGIGTEQLWVLYFLHSTSQNIRVGELANALLKKISQLLRACFLHSSKRDLSKSKKIPKISGLPMCISQNLVGKSSRVWHFLKKSLICFLTKP